MKKVLILALAGALFLEIDPVSIVIGGTSSTDAQARIGRPATPGSIAGVARRTTRRAWRRTAYAVAVLPAGCVKTSLYGSLVWQCGGTYYQSSGGSYVVVVVD
jgi:hypothetical protein